MLKDLTDEKLIRLNIEAADWEEAIRKSAQPLIDHPAVSAVLTKAAKVLSDWPRHRCGKAPAAQLQ